MGISNFDIIKANSYLGGGSDGAKVFFVNSATTGLPEGAIGGSNGNSGLSPLEPFADIDAAIGKCTAARGDKIIVLPAHTETVTSAITLDVAGVQIIGLKHGNQRPTITPNGAIDCMTITAADCRVEGLLFAAPVTDAQLSDINVAAANVSIVDTVHIGSDTALNKVDIITLEAGSHDCLIDGVRIYNDVVEVVGGIVLEGISSRVEIRNCFIWDSVGFTNGAISDEATCLAAYIHHNVIKNAKAGTVVLEFGNNTTGVCSFNHISGRHTTIASNVTTGTGMDFFENRVTEEAQLNGAIIPAADSE